MKLRLVVPMVLGAIGAIAIGCGGGGGGRGGGGGTGNAAVDATLTTLYTSMRSGSTNIDGSITIGTVPNPIAAPASNTSFAAAVGSAANDGTVRNLTITYIASFNSTNGSFSQSETVNETATNFQFMSTSFNASPLNFSIRVPSLGAAGISTGTMNGQFFAILTVSRTGTLTRNFTNASTGSLLTLVNFGTVTPLPGATVSTQASQSIDFILQYSITGTPPVAKLVNIFSAGNSGLTTRTNGPSISAMGQSYTSVTFGGVGYQTNTDVSVPVGTDLPGGIAANSQVNVQGSVTGGFPSNTAAVTTLVTVVRGPLVGTPFTFTTTTFAVGSTLAGLATVNNGTIEVNQPITVSSSQTELPIGVQAFSHSLDGRLVVNFAMQQALWQPEGTGKKTAFLIFE